MQGLLKEARKAEVIADKLGDTEVDISTVVYMEMETEMMETTDTVMTEMTHFQNMVSLVQAALQQGPMDEEAVWQ